MATKVASLYADVNANIGGFMSGMTAVRGSLTGVAGMFGTFSNAAVAALGAVGIGALAMQQALEFGDVGAQIGQTESAFNSLATSLGQGPELLNDLQDATRGTVSELDLMRSTSTLLMGTTGDLGKQLAAAAPQLAAIAQAAHDLNPTMGTTAEMYDRLSRGIKKAEPELLDEVGILMNLTQVYKEYAAAHGITVSAMDKTMKTEAMLNAVLTQGNTLIQQAGNVANDTATSIDQMQAALTDVGNAFKADVAPYVANFANSLLDTRNSTNELTRSMQQQSDQAIATSGSYAEYVASMEAAAAAQEAMIGYNGELINSTGVVIQKNFLLSESAWAAAKSIQGVNNSTAQLGGGLSTLDAKAAGFGMSVTNLSGGLSMLGETMTVSTETVGASEEAWQAYGDRLTALAGYYAQVEAAEQQRIMTAGLLAGLQGTLGQATQQYTQTLAQLQTQEASLTAEIEKATLRYGENSTKVKELTEALNLNREQQGQSLEALQKTTAAMIFQQAAAGLDTQAALDLARSMGLLSEQDYVVATSLEALRQEFDLNKDGMISAAEGADQFASQVSAITKAAQNLQAKGLPITFENLTKELTEMSTTGASTEIGALEEAGERGAGGMEAVAGAAAEVAKNVGDAVEPTSNEAAEIAAIGDAAGAAASGIDAVAGAARRSVTPLRDSARAAGDLASELSSLDTHTTISVSVSGVDSAIAELERLRDAIAAVPTSISINASVSSGAPTSTTSPTYDLGMGSTTVASAPVTEIYNVYDPLAAVILAESRRARAAEKLEALLNG